MQPNVYRARANDLHKETGLCNSGRHPCVHVIFQNEHEAAIKAIQDKLSKLDEYNGKLVESNRLLAEERDGYAYRLDESQRQLAYHERKHGDLIVENVRLQNRLDSLQGPLISLIKYARDTGYWNTDDLDELCKHGVVEKQERE